jgi:hypothetical protein
MQGALPAGLRMLNRRFARVHFSERLV